MEPLGYLPYYEKLEILAEIDIRGRFMMMAADIEFTLMNIMVYSAPDPLNSLRRFKKMMMHEKIQNTITDLKNYKPDLYKNYAEHLKQLWEFKEIRNHLAHNILRFEQSEKPTYFEVIYVDEELGIQHIRTKEYTINYISDVIKRFRKLNMTLSNLHRTVQDEFILKNEINKPFG